MIDFFTKLFDTRDFPARWHCGQWTAGHGWLHIASDLAIFGAYMTIPLILVWFVSRRKDLPFPRVFWLFAAFILFCGVTHLNEAIIFWNPVYRWAGLLKFGTAVVSWATVLALVPVVRQAVTLKTQGQVEAEIATRTIQLEQRAETEAERFKNIVESSEDAILTKDSRGTILTWNPGAERMYGYTAAEAIGQNIKLILPEGLLEEYETLLADVASGLAAVNLRTQRKTQAGHQLEVSLTVSPLRDRTGAVVGTSTIARDVTEQVHAEELFRAAVEASPSGMLLVDGGGRIVLANREAEILFGYPRQELEALEIEALIPEPLRDQHVKQRSEYVRQPDRRPMARGRELFALRQDASQFPVDVILTPVDRLGRRLTLAAVLDITDRKAAEQLQAEANATLERRVEERTAELARSNADLEQFAYVASHDLKEPLRMVSSYCELLREELSETLPPEGKTYLGFAVDGAKRMQDLLSDLLAYSRVGSRGGNFVRAPSAEILQAVRDDLQFAIEEAGAELTVAPDLPELRCDPVQLRQLFQNLIANALRFTSEAPPRIRVSVEETDAGWRFAVADNGIGLDMKHAERIFTIFRRLDPRAFPQGTGIGLAIAKRIVERHQGRIWVESTLGEGATFYVELGKPPA